MNAMSTPLAPISEAPTDALASADGPSPKELIMAARDGNVAAVSKSLRNPRTDPNVYAEYVRATKKACMSINRLPTWHVNLHTAPTSNHFLINESRAIRCFSSLSSVATSTW